MPSQEYTQNKKTKMQEIEHLKLCKQMMKIKTRLHFRCFHYIKLVTTP